MNLPGVTLQVAGGAGVVVTHRAAERLLSRVDSEMSLKLTVLIRLVLALSAVVLENTSVGVLTVEHLVKSVEAVAAFVTPEGEVACVSPAVVVQGAFGLKHLATLVAAVLSLPSAVDGLHVSLQTVLVLHHLPTDLTGNILLHHPNTVSHSQVLLEQFLSGTEVATVVTGFGETGVVIQTMVLQSIRHGELFTTLLAGESFVVILFHVKTEHSDGCVREVTRHAPHDVSVLQFLCFESLVRIVSLLRSAGGQLVSSVVSLQGLVHLELTLAPVTLVVPLGDTWLLPVC